MYYPLKIKDAMVAPVLACLVYCPKAFKVVFKALLFLLDWKQGPWLWYAIARAQDLHSQYSASLIELICKPICGFGLVFLLLNGTTHSQQRTRRDRLAKDSLTFE